MYQVIQFIFALLSHYQGTKAQIRFALLSFFKKKVDLCFRVSPFFI